MRIIVCELKKIWNPKTLVAVALLSAMYYVAFMSFYVDAYPNNPQSAAELSYCLQLKERYGATLEPEELEEFVAQTRGELILEADRYIAGNERLAGLGIRNYWELREAIERLSVENPTEQQRRDLDAIFEEFYWAPGGNRPDTKRLMEHPEENSVGVRIEVLDNIAQRYQAALDTGWTRDVISGYPGSAFLRARFEEMTGSEEYRSIIPSEILWYAPTYVKYLSILEVIVTLLMLSPLIAADRIGKVHLLQYSIKEGRRILGKQFAAALISSATITTALIAVFGAIFAANGTQIFWDQDVSSFNSFYYASVRLTYGQLVYVMAGMLYLLGASASAAAFVLSRFCSNYVALIAGAIPAAVAGAMLCNYIVFDRPLNAFVQETGVALFEPLVCAVLLAAGAVAVACITRRERKLDVV